MIITKIRDGIRRGLSGLKNRSSSLSAAFLLFFLIMSFSVAQVGGQSSEPIITVQGFLHTNNGACVQGLGLFNVTVSSSLPTSGDPFSGSHNLDFVCGERQVLFDCRCEGPYELRWDIVGVYNGPISEYPHVRIRNIIIQRVVDEFNANNQQRSSSSNVHSTGVLT